MAVEQSVAADRQSTYYLTQMSEKIVNEGEN